MVKIGLYDGSFLCGSKMHSVLQLQEGSTLCFRGKAGISRGVVINNGGEICFGNNFSSNFGLFITCSSKIEFGDDCLLGWNNTFIDNDGHRILNADGEVTSSARKITVGSHCWITSETTFLKGSGAGDDCVVGYGAFMQKDFSGENNVLIAGRPACVCRTEINWKK